MLFLLRIPQLPRSTLFPHATIFGSVLEAKVHSAKVPDQDGIALLLERARDRFPRLSHLWVDAGYRGRGKEWGRNGPWA